MQTARKATPKPSLDAKLQAWGRAFHIVLDEIKSEAKYDDAALAETAAQVAAQLVAGAALEE